MKVYWLEHPTDECPSVDDLVATGSLDRDSARRDSWGQAWHIECHDGEAVVSSTGRDGTLGTDDDIRVPPI